MNRLKIFGQETFIYEDIKRRMLFNYLEFFKKDNWKTGIDPFEKIIFAIKKIKNKENVLVNFKENFGSDLIDLFIPFLSGYFFLAQDFDQYDTISEELDNFLGSADEIYNLLEDKEELTEEEQKDLLVLFKDFVQYFPKKITDFEKWFK